MKFAREILGLLLIAALVMAAWSTDALADHASGPSTGLLAARGEPPAGCHAHGGNSLPDSPNLVPDFPESSSGFGPSRPKTHA